MSFLKSDDSKPGELLLKAGIVLFILAAIAGFVVPYDETQRHFLLATLVGAPLAVAFVLSIIVVVELLYDLLFGGHALAHYIFAFKFNWRSIVGSFLLVGTASFAAKLIYSFIA